MSTNQWGGSLRAPRRPGDPEHPALRAQVDGDPELQKILNAGPEPINLVTEKAVPPDWLNKAAPKSAPAPVAKNGSAARPSPFAKPAAKQKPPLPSFQPLATPRAPYSPPEEAPPAAPTAPEAAPPADSSSPPPPTASATNTPEAPKPYECVYYWKNDPETFSAMAVLTGDVSDVCFLNEATEVRFRAITAAERQQCDAMLPPMSDGVLAKDSINERRALLRLAHAIVTINDQPMGRSLDEAVRVLERFPEMMLQVLSDAAWEFQVRLTLRIKGSEEQLKN